MYSPFQEVPSTPSLSMYTAILHNPCTPEAVVPDVVSGRANSPGTPEKFFSNLLLIKALEASKRHWLINDEQSWSVPGTPASSTLTSSPWTPNVRSLTRAKTQQGRRYIYNPSLITSLFRNTPSGNGTLKEQVVPSTPVGGFLLPSTPTRTPRPAVTPRVQVSILSINSNDVQSPDINDDRDTIDAAGDRPRKRAKIENKPGAGIHTTPKSRPRGERREAVANFRSPDAARSSAGDSSATHDFLDLI